MFASLKGYESWAEARAVVLVDVGICEGEVVRVCSIGVVSSVLGGGDVAP